MYEAAFIRNACLWTIALVWLITASCRRDPRWKENELYMRQRHTIEHTVMLARVGEASAAFRAAEDVQGCTTAPSLRPIIFLLSPSLPHSPSAKRALRELTPRLPHFPSSRVKCHHLGARTHTHTYTHTGTEKNEARGRET